MQSWNFIVESELPGSMIGSVGYVGTATVRSFVDININVAEPGTASRGRSFFEKFGRTANTLDWNGRLSTSYHSLQATVNRRVAEGLTIKGAYTYSAAINMTDDDGWAGVMCNIPSQFSRNRVRAGYDQNQIFQMGYVYRNEGDDTFANVTDPEVDDDRWSTSAAFCDYDGDGRIDLFVANYIDFTVRNNKRCFDAAGARDYCAPKMFHPVPDALLRNLGRGRFVNVTVRAGSGSAFGNGLGIACVDGNSDNRPDLYVANDGMPNQLWRNRGDGAFEDVAFGSGSAVKANGLAEAGMDVASADFDADGDEDLLVTHLASETNTLYRDNGSGEFRDVTDRFGLGSSSFPNTGFGTAWLDYDTDGWLDLFVANGAVIIVESLRGEPYPFHQRNQLLRSVAGERFVDVTDMSRPALEVSEVSRGAAVGDLDNDGDSDLAVTNNRGRVRLLLNQIENRNDWIPIRVEGRKSNRDGYGARVAVLRGSQDALWRRCHTDGSYLSAGDPRLHFGLGKSAPEVDVGVVWPDGSRELWHRLAVNTAHVLREGTGGPWSGGR